jgi:flagellar basal body-associated protein FliL
VRAGANNTSAAGVSGVTIAIIGIFAVVVAVVIAVALYCFLRKPSLSPADSSEKELYKIYDSYTKENVVSIRLNDSFSESGLTHPMQSFNREFFQHPNQQQQQQQGLVQNSHLQHLFDPADESGMIPSQDNPTHRRDVGII